MEIILKEDVKGLGYKNDTVKVKDGYGRNYLIPQKLAVIANESNRRATEENIRQVAHKAEKIKTAALEMAEKIGNSVFTIKTKAGETGKIFGAITAIQIVDVLHNKGFTVDRRKVSGHENIKVVGTHTVVLDLHKEVKHALTLEIVSE